MSTLYVDDVAGQGGGSSTNLMSGLAKAWYNFTSVGTPALSGSFNVASLTDNSAGDYTVNLTNNMSNSVYSVTMCMDIYTIFALAYAQTASAINVNTTYPYDGVRYYSGSKIMGTVVGDLA